MPALREQDFDKLATQVVDEFLAKRAKLADAAANVAMQNQMNPDQIERLTQSANTMAFLRMMENTKAQGGQDLTQEFDPIDSRQVIRIVIDQTGVHVEADPSVDVQSGHGGGMGGAEHELPDEMTALRGGGEDPHAQPQGMPGMPETQGAPGMPGMPGDDAPPPDGMPEGLEGAEGDEDDEGDEKAPPFGKKPKAKAKTKDEDKPEKKKPETPKEAAQRMMRTRKLADILEDQRLQADLVFEETFDKLAARFKRIYTAVSFEAFEKDALAEHGDEYGVQILNGLREARHLPPLEETDARNKIASLEDRHVTEESIELSLFGDLVKTAQEAKRLEQGIAVLRAQCA